MSTQQRRKTKRMTRKMKRKTIKKMTKRIRRRNLFIRVDIINTKDKSMMN